MRFVGPLVLLGLLLVGAGFVVGTEPVTSHGAACGSVLAGAPDRPSDPVTPGCRSARHGRRLVATLGLLGVGGAALTVAWTAHREGRPRRRERVS
jgi:hypothetical protein